MMLWREEVYQSGCKNDLQGCARSLQDVSIMAKKTGKERAHLCKVFPDSSSNCFRERRPCFDDLMAFS